MATGTPTPSVGLSQWQLDDKLRMDEFNADNQKADSAIGALRTEVATKAGLEDLTNGLAGKADRSELDGKADLADLEELASTINAEALEALTARVEALEQGSDAPVTPGNLPAQSRITVTPKDSSAEVSIKNSDSENWLGTKLVYKEGNVAPMNLSDGVLEDAGMSSEYLITRLTNDQNYTIRAFAYNQNGQAQTSIDGAVASFAPAKTLGDMPTGSIIKIKENGVLRDYKVAQHNYIKSGVTALERVLCLTSTAVFASNGNKYEGGSLDVLLTGTFRNTLDQNVRDSLVKVNIPCTVGNKSTTVVNIPRDVFVFSGTELGMSHTYMVVEGSKVDIYSSNASRIKYGDDAPTTARDRWSRSAYTNLTDRAWYVSTSGAAHSNTATLAYYFAPVLTLPSALLLSSNGEVLG